MCGRYALYGPHSRLREKMLLVECPEYGERYNITPQSNIPIIRFKREVGRVGQLVKWGLIPSWAKSAGIGNKLNNARGETVAEKAAFRSSFAKHRCLIPASGFYEWKGIEEGGKVRKQPYYICPNEPDSYFAFAGLLAAWKAPGGETIVSTCIITTEPNEVMAPIHGRMPVILQPSLFDMWLDPSNGNINELKSMLGPCSSESMHAYPVSNAINRGGVEGEGCILPIENE